MLATTLPPTLAQVKAHLKLAASASDEDSLLAGYLASAVGAFKVASKRRWPEAGDVVLTVVTDATTVPITTKEVGYADPAVLGPDEQPMAYQWLLLTLGHWYENRQTVAVGLNVTEVPATAQMLMKLLREPTI